MNPEISSPDAGATERLFQTILDTADDLLSRLERRSDPVDFQPSDCLRLMASIGELKFGIWSEFVDRPTSARMEAQRRQALERLASQLPGSEFLECLVNGLRLKIRGVSRELQKIDRAIKRPRPGMPPHIGPDEFDSEIAFPFEQIVYADWLASELRSQLPQDVHAEVALLEELMRKILPVVAQAFVD